MNPGDEYRARAAARRGTFDALAQDERRISNLRLLTFGAGVLLAVFAWGQVLSVYWLALPLVAFVVLVRRHDRVIRDRDNAAHAQAFYERGLCRLEDRWIGTGESGERFRNDDHLYANDLDLFGRGSLFELLSIARTRAGEETVAAWLQAPAAPDEIASRHEAIVELTPALDLREALSLAGASVRTAVHTEDLVAWAEGPSRLGPPGYRRAAVALTAITVATLALWAIAGSFVPFLLALIAQGVFMRPLRSRVDAVLHSAEAPARDLLVLRQLLLRIEGESFRAPKLAALRARIARHPREAGAPGDVADASEVIGRLVRLIEAHDWEHNIVFTPVAVLLMWGTHIAWAVEAWRARHGHEIGAWLRAVGEMEALSSLSAYRYEHPGDPFPEIVPPAARGNPGVFEGESLGHPLLPAARMVRNDLSLGDERGLLVVSGSNMSGKSTLLRTVGANVVLALAGAPVRASRLRLTPLAIGATLRIQDSLQEGRSRFYAEITRIRAIVDLAERELPLLFLLDELFHGTNSHDRLVGASGVLRGLLERGAIGLITTHDLALTAIAGDLAPRAANVHFEDRFEGGEIRFDYRMREGPVTRSNALALMRAVGLQVAEPVRPEG